MSLSSSPPSNICVINFMLSALGDDNVVACAELCKCLHIKISCFNQLRKKCVRDNHVKSDKSLSASSRVRNILCKVLSSSSSMQPLFEHQSSFFTRKISDVSASELDVLNI